LPEVSLVIILDADKEGFLRSEVSLLQTAGRAARHVEGKVIMYADRMTDSMLNMISESSRRRQVQIEFNKKNNITPKSIIKAIQEGIEQERKAQQFTREVVGEDEKTFEAKDRLAYLERKMEEASRALDFERAARLRDKIMELAKEYKVELPWEEKK
jgi:excinuclease ABC subunit B